MCVWLGGDERGKRNLPLTERGVLNFAASEARTRRDKNMFKSQRFHPLGRGGPLISF